jgi:hypothetical protein
MNSANPSGVFAVQCPNPACGKFMLVEEHDRGKVVQCLICKKMICVGAATPPSVISSRRTPPPIR